MSINHKERGNVSPTYRCWLHLRERCNNPNDAAYQHYGGRGISVCKRWNSFENFLADMGEKPEGLTLDRKDNDSNYTLDNCHWVTWDEQAQNRRSTKLTYEKAVTICVRSLKGEMNSLLADEYGVDRPAISKIVLGQRWYGALEEAQRRIASGEA